MRLPMRLINALRARLFGDGDAPDQAGYPADEAPLEPAMTADEQPAPDEGVQPDRENDVDPPEPLAALSFADAVPGRQERAAGRILDDEGLRSDLTDDEYQPLLDWALTVTDQLAAATADLDDEQAEAALDGGLQAVRDALRAAQEAIVAQNEGRPDDQQVALDAARAAVATLAVEAPEMPLPALTEVSTEAEASDAVTAEPEATEPEPEAEPDSEANS